MVSRYRRYIARVTAALAPPWFSPPRHTTKRKRARDDTSSLVAGAQRRLTIFKYYVSHSQTSYFGTPSSKYSSFASANPTSGVSYGQDSLFPLAKSANEAPSKTDQPGSPSPRQEDGMDVTHVGGEPESYVLKPKW
jgi:hypothetical protein